VDRAVDAAPPARLAFAALTIASAATCVMSPWTSRMRRPSTTSSRSSSSAIDPELAAVGFSHRS
jgi:hypothetical protein